MFMKVVIKNNILFSPMDMMVVMHKVHLEPKKQRVV